MREALSILFLLLLLSMGWNIRIELKLQQQEIKIKNCEQNLQELEKKQRINSQDVQFCEFLIKEMSKND